MGPEAERLVTRWNKSHMEMECRRSRAQNFASALAKDLGKADPDLRAILGFGSTFELWRQYRHDSDIDLALVGGDWGMLWSMIPKSEFSVSLIQLDEQPEAFAEQVRSQGVLLYEKQ